MVMLMPLIEPHDCQPVKRTLPRRDSLLLLLSEDVCHGNLQPVRDRLQHVERHILLTDFNAVQRGCRDARALFELNEGPFASRFAEEYCELASELLAHP